MQPGKKFIIMGNPANIRTYTDTESGWIVQPAVPVEMGRFSLSGMF